VTKQGFAREERRAQDLGSTITYLEADAPRVSCPVDGVVVVQVLWADHNARFTRSFDDQIAWLAVECSRTAVSELMRFAWRSVGSVLTRVSGRLEQGQDRLAGQGRIGIDGISWRRRQRYLIVVVDHDSGRLVWAAPGRDEATLERFFEQLGEERCDPLNTHLGIGFRTVPAQRTRIPPRAGHRPPVQFRRQLDKPHRPTSHTCG
jgi:transposase